MEKKPTTSFKPEFNGKEVERHSKKVACCSASTCTFKRAGEMNFHLNMYYIRSAFYLQERKGFNLEEFTDKHKLLKFSFVRHPYER